MNTFKRLISPDDSNYRYKTTVFLICLVISSSIWFLTKFASQYPVEIRYSLKFSGVPEDRVLVNQSDSVLRINVKASGFALLKHQYFNKTKPFEVNVGQFIGLLKGESADVTVDSDLIARQIKETQGGIPGTIEYVFPEALVFRLDRGNFKEVPLIPDVSYTLMKQYFAYDSLMVEPSTVRIFGISEDLSKINYVKTAPLKLDNLSESVDRAVEILNPRQTGGIRVEPTSARITLQVEKFTEAGIEVPIQPVNLPSGMRVKLFPEKVTVYYMVALKDFKRIDPEMFNCKVNLSKLKEQTGQRISVEVTNSPSYVKLQRVAPPDVEFIILK